MSGEFIYDNYGRTEEFRLKKTSANGIEKGLKKIIIIALIVLGAEFIWFFCISPCIPFSTVEVRGFPGFDGETVLNFAGIGGSASFATVNAANAEKLLAGHYLVESARVVKRFPDRISIFLEQRKAVARSLVTVEDRQLPVYYDKKGVVFQIGGEISQASAAPSVNLPILSGLIITEPSLGMRLPAALLPLLEECDRILAASPELMSAISEIRINRKPFDGFDLVLYPVYYPVRVQLGNSINEETLRYVMLVLNVIGQRKTWPQEIDFRSGMSSYTIKEVPSVE